MNRILHCVFEIIVLRGEPGSTTLQPSMHSSFMDPLPTHLPLMMKANSQTCVSMDGMNGVTSGIRNCSIPQQQGSSGKSTWPCQRSWK